MSSTFTYLLTYLLTRHIMFRILFGLLLHSISYSFKVVRIYAARPVERGSFPGPRDVWGARDRSKILKKVFQMASLLSDLKYA